MKKMKLLLLASLTVVASAAFAQDKSDTVKVYGKCGMCKARIEKAANGIKGVKNADWNVDTKMLVVTYDHQKTSSDDIQKKIAAIGHDTEKYTAEAAAYKNLPECCYYQRKPGSQAAAQPKSTEGHSGHHH